ncbi:MAG TPA: DinB family protein [Longimicrobiaceae bacterium]|nr:DinB family protein [Longimicrobiaceae bacterium]
MSASSGLPEPILDRVDAAISDSFPASDPPSWTLGSTQPQAAEREAWLRGPIDGVNPYLMPAAHALIQAGEDLHRAAESLTTEELWEKTGGAASLGFHLTHIPGTIDRLLTYARGEMLSDNQLKALKRESDPGKSSTATDLLQEIAATVGRALTQIRNTPEEDLLQPREVGRKRLPSTVLGLISHAAEHTQRHTGQVITTAKILRGLRRGGR